MFTFGISYDLERVFEVVLRLSERVMGFHNDWMKA